MTLAMFVIGSSARRSGRMTAGYRQGADFKPLPFPRDDRPALAQELQRKGKSFF
jgi:hypothetical protein